jgi:hypothetical protein
MLHNKREMLLIHRKTKAILYCRSFAVGRANLDALSSLQTFDGEITSISLLRSSVYVNLNTRISDTCRACIKRC